MVGGGRSLRQCTVYSNCTSVASVRSVFRVDNRIFSDSARRRLLRVTRTICFATWCRNCNLIIGQNFTGLPQLMKLFAQLHPEDKFIPIELCRRIRGIIEKVCYVSYVSHVIGVWLLYVECLAGAQCASSLTLRTMSCLSSVKRTYRTGRVSQQSSGPLMSATFLYYISYSVHFSRVWEVYQKPCVPVESPQSAHIPWAEGEGVFFTTSVVSEREEKCFGRSRRVHLWFFYEIFTATRQHKNPYLRDGMLDRFIPWMYALSQIWHTKLTVAIVFELVDGMAIKTFHAAGAESKAYLQVQDCRLGMRKCLYFAKTQKVSKVMVQCPSVVARIFET